MTTDQAMADSEQRKKTILAAVFLGIAAAVFLYTYWPRAKFSTTRAYFTDDDGKTWYADDVNNIPPYMHNGKEAVRINVYKTDDHPQPFAGYLTKFPADVKDQIERQAKQTKPPRPASDIAYAGEMPNRLLAKPALKNVPWATLQSPEGVKAMTVVPPDSSVLDSVVPMD